MAEEKKPVHSIVLDAGPLIANTPSISTLLKKSEQIFTTPSVVGEIRDASARARLDTLVMPFITLRTPSSESMKFVTEFARKSGDLPMLSKTDLEVIALAYELECERNGGDWRLRRTPGQKTVNGSPPSKTTDDGGTAGNHADAQPVSESSPATAMQGDAEAHAPPTDDVLEDKTSEVVESIGNISIESDLKKPTDPTAQNLAANGPSEGAATVDMPQANAKTAFGDQEPRSAVSNSDVQIIEESSRNSPDNTSDLSSETDADSDGGEWITPSNITRHKTSQDSASAKELKQPKSLQVATLTTDHTLQNTLLLINLNLLSSSLTRIAHIKSHILRCHACFATTKQMEKQFCPRCGQAALTRVTTSVNANGTTTLHLKKNMQWNTRGNRYSIPKPVSGTSSGKMREKGGGKGGWGKDLILAEDQKEYVRAVQDREREKRKGERDLLDQDFLPGLMGGDRNHGLGGRIQIGAGRNVNSKKRR